MACAICHAETHARSECWYRPDRVDARQHDLDFRLAAVARDEKRLNLKWTAIGLGSAGILAAGTALGWMVKMPPPAEVCQPTICPDCPSATPVVRAPPKGAWKPRVDAGVAPSSSAPLTPPGP